MVSRAEQKEQTRERIVRAALEGFAERGFHGASTREIARRADTNQGLITYHFKTKDELWRAAADLIFGELREQVLLRLEALASEDPGAQARAAIREYVHFAARYPELFRMMVEEGKEDAPRMQWLVDTHLRRFYEEMPGLQGMEERRKAHLFYILAGAASTIFAIAPECRRLTGMDPQAPEAIDAHADLLVSLLVP